MSNNLSACARALALAVALTAAPAAQAFGPDDAGIYAVYDKDHKETDAALRFYILKEKWVAEERAKDGSWVPFACSTDCELVPIPPAQIKLVFGKALDLVVPSCIANSHVAVCSYTQKANPTGGVGYLMTVNSPKGMLLLHIARIEKL
jgi:hypothetical protein